MIAEVSSEDYYGNSMVNDTFEVSLNNIDSEN